MVWCEQVTSDYVVQCWLMLRTQICVTLFRRYGSIVNIHSQYRETMADKTYHITEKDPSKHNKLTIDYSSTSFIVWYLIRNIQSTESNITRLAQPVSNGNVIYMKSKSHFYQESRYSIKEFKTWITNCILIKLWGWISCIITQLRFIRTCLEEWHMYEQTVIFHWKIRHAIIYHVAA